MSSILSARDINAPITTDPSANNPSTKDNTNKPTTTTKNMSMDYHRQVLQSKLNEDKYVSLPVFPSPLAHPPFTPPSLHLSITHNMKEPQLTPPPPPGGQRSHQKTYISPSDTIQSPCTQKLSAFKEKRFSKAKPQSLFAKTTAGRGVGLQQQQQQHQSMEGKGVGKEEGEGLFGTVEGAKEA